MTNEQKAAYINAQSTCLLATVLGMQAENMQRQVLGQSMAYTDKDFTEAINDSGCHHNAIMELFNA